MYGLRLKHIRNVVAVAECGSLRAAARSLEIAQPVLTRSIQDAERILGASLFERTSKGVSLTHAGSVFVQRAAVIQQELSRAQDEVAQISGVERGHIHVGLSTVAHLTLLPKVLPAFRKRFPLVEITITEGLLPRLRGSLEDSSLDFYVGPLLETRLGADLLSEHLFDNERLVFCRPGHPLAGATSLEQLRGAEWISTSVTNNSQAELTPVFERHGISAPNIVLHASSALTMVLGAAHSDLLAMLPRQWLEFPSMEKLLVPIHIQERLEAPSIHVVRRGRLPLTPAAQTFYDLICRAGLNVGLAGKGDT